ncbi:MAG: aminotransferase class I/II-fold pyridoxal phosphate-dependent enzyme [Pseudolabrys sp.]|jgi:aspartate aminotransferase
MTGQPKLAERVSSMKPSATVEMSERIRQGRAAGRTILGLSSGDPNLPTDPRIIEAAERAMRGGETHYSTPAGMPVLREAIVQYELKRSGAAYDASDILVTPGGKFALLTALMGVVNPGDEVLVPEPGWVSYGPCVRLCGGKPVALAMLDRVDPDMVEKAVTGATRAIILNSPVNPTGRILPKAELDAIVKIAQRHNLWIIFDQVYADLTYDKSIAFPQASAAGHERTLVIDSTSKTFGMTGWRLGYLAAPSGLAKQIVKFLQHSIYCVPPFIQLAGVEAIRLYDELVPQYRALFRNRLERAVQVLSSVDGVDCRMSEATFYLFPKVAGDDAVIARRWLETLDVATLPGSAFGAAGAGHLRLSLTVSDADLDAALQRIAAAGIGQS